MGEKSAEFKPLHFYHVYNRAIGNERLFREQKNYTFFLKKWNSYLNGYLDVWAYCLIPNHFHFLVRIKGENRLSKFQKLGKSQDEILVNQFRKLFISYTKSFNKTYNRTGSLFQKCFKRVEVDSKRYLQHLIHYIHHNPIHHNFVGEYLEWEYSSYQSILSTSSTKVYRKGVLNLFSNREKFRSYHDKMKNYDQISHLIPE